MNEVREKMDEEMIAILEKMGDTDVNSDNYVKLTKRLTELGQIRNEALKIECDYERQAEHEDDELQTKLTELEEERKRFKITTILDGVKIGTSILLFVGLAVAESRGTFTNLSTKSLFNGMRFGIKR